MSLAAQSVALEAIHSIRPLLPAIQRRDKALVVQLTKAASSVVLNIAEGDRNDPGTRRARFYTAAGSASEARAALEVAVAWGYLTAERAAPAAELLDRVLAMLWKLNPPR